MFRPAHTLATTALAASLLSACGSTPVPPASAAQPAPSGTVAGGRTAECARLGDVLDAEMRDVPAAEIRSTTPLPRVEALMHRLEQSCDDSERLSDSLTDPVLATEANDFRLATAYLLLTTAHLFGLAHKGESDLAPFDRAADVAGRQRELVYRSAKARCRDDGSRDQSPAWGEALMATVQEVRPAVHACYLKEKERSPDRKIGELEIKLHIDHEGHVELAGPIDFSALSPASPELVYCLVRVLEPMRFAPPEGRAIVILPFTE
ncbi:hypothetical protein [Polyangium jinanense]|uniref:AgmX/PglI C-terminal domain-containing protein n=1 Tax=Polyangium jinanense TaxID=2829994 RepID=A0A9X4AVH4_9BACT|nr:hypothetical protein [Polyangium jinanense]MDC3959878.1 hypothetical protein [Polyangium jinanense]MDC3986329.1 hypothetical protein [Polyangium jinanense]